MAQSELRELGKQKFTEVTQETGIEATDQFMVENIDQCFGGLWGRPGLTRRERRFLSLATVGTRGMDFEVKYHIRGALQSGDLSPAEMLEIILHVRQYAGWPSGSVMYRHFRQICADLDLEIPAPDTES